MLTNKRALGFRDVLISPQPSDVKSRKEVSLERTFKFKNGTEITCVPIIASNMRSIGKVSVAIELSKYKILTCLHKDTPLTTYAWHRFDTRGFLEYCIPTIGLNKWDDLEYLFKYNVPIKIICLDVANGYMDEFVKFTHRIATGFPHWVIMAGNVATAEGAERLYDAGADIVKVGLGSGSVCTTRFKTGVGVPQVSAIDSILCYNRYVNSPRYICSDGGCTNPGDVAKAFVAGADFVMLGGMFAGTKETGSTYQGEAHISNGDYKTSEGKKVSFDVSGETLERRVTDLLGGLRSCGSYIGQRKIEDFYKAELIQVKEQTNNWLGSPS